MIVEIRHSLNPREFISHPVIRCHTLYQWFRKVLDSASISTCFEVHTQHTPIAVRIIRSIWWEHVTELTNDFEISRRLDSATARTFTQPARLHEINTRRTDGMRDNNNTNNSSIGYDSSSYMKADTVDSQHSKPVYQPSVSRTSANTYKP